MINTGMFSISLQPGSAARTDDHERLRQIIETWATDAGGAEQPA